MRVLGIDGGNSKVDVALMSDDGTLLAAERAGTISHQVVGVEGGMRRLEEVATRLAERAGLGEERPIADLVVASVAGADFPSDIRLLRSGFERLRLGADVVVVNDTIGALRAGTSRSWGIALVCGQGINASGIAPNGRIAGFAAVGEFSGDWGGGGGVGMAALHAAVRGEDGRSPHTTLERLVPAFFGLRRPAAVTRALYEGRIRQVRTIQLAPIVFAEAMAGDAVARAIVDRLATELAAWATALIRRLHMTRLDVEVVLAGGVFRTQDREFYALLERHIRDVAPRATLVHLACPPVAGAVLLGLDRLAGGEVDSDVAARARAALGEWDRHQPSVHELSPEDPARD